MYFWKTHLLVDDLKRSSLGETDFKNYYLATSIFTSACLYLVMLGSRENMFSLATEAIGTLLVTVLGINAAFTANGGPTGIRFLEKAVSISFPLLVKVLVGGFAVGFLVAVLEISGLSKYQTEWATAIGIVAVQCVLFWRLVVHVRHTNA